jgi:hypothetical protein
MGIVFAILLAVTGIGITKLDGGKKEDKEALGNAVNQEG